MQDTNPTNQSLNTSGGLPPLPSDPTPTATTTSGNIGGDSTWPAKKKNNKLKYILGGLLALILVGGTAFGAFYFTRNLNQASVPNAPESKPQAAAARPGAERPGINDQGVWVNPNIEKDSSTGKTTLNGDPIRLAENGQVIRGGNEESGGGGANTGGQPSCSISGPTNMVMTNISTSSAKLSWTPGVGNYVKLWVSTKSDPTADCGRLANKATDASCVANENGSLLNGDPNHADIPATTTSWTLTNLAPNTTYYWRLMMWSYSGCDSGPGPISFTTSAACTDSTWTPDPALTCVGTNVSQTSNCGTTRTTAGTKTIGTCCTSTTWTPATNTVCINTSFVQTDNCTATRSAVGVKSDGACSASTQVDLNINKVAYEDESGNKAGDYELSSEIDSVSKNQIFVYAFEVTNDGDNKVEDIKVVDTLKGDNTDLLTYVDGDDRCSYASSTRKVTCDGMDLDGGESDTYAFRVKVSSNAINGDTIMNAGEISYKNMPDGGEIDASSELTISTVVGCNHVCTSDDECSTGLTCDTDTNKCRKPACADASTCNCPVEKVVDDSTPTPTRRATVARVEPTELVEAGILDFPGVATFGGGLLLAVIGILLAL